MVCPDCFKLFMYQSICRSAFHQCIKQTTPPDGADLLRGFFCLVKGDVSASCCPWSALVPSASDVATVSMETSLPLPEGVSDIDIIDVGVVAEELLSESEEEVDVVPEIV